MLLLTTFVGAKVGILEARIAKIQAGIEAKKAYVEQKATNHIQKICANLLYDAAMASPQWSGDYASNWRIVTDSIPGYDPQLKVNPWQSVENPYEMGDDLAVSIAVDRGRSSVDKVRWNMPIYLVNTASVSDLLEAGQVNLRPVNKLSPEMSVVSYLKMNYRCMP